MQDSEKVSVNNIVSFIQFIKNIDSCGIDAFLTMCIENQDDPSFYSRVALQCFTASNILYTFQLPFSP